MFPGLAVLDRVRDYGYRTAWIGSSVGMERSIVRAHGVPFHGIPAGKLRRYRSIRNLSDVFRVAAGIVRACGIIRRERPSVLFSKGGFVSVPPVVAAWLHGVAVISHESDADPGLATRINGRFSRLMLVAYAPAPLQASASARRRRRIVVTGNPIRPEIFRGDRGRGLQSVGFEPGDPRLVLLVLGGSQGAAQLNRVVAEILPRVSRAWRVIHQTGTHEVDASGADSSTYAHAPFYRTEVPDLLAAADVVLCRAGASTIWEAACLAKPMLLVPLIAGSRGDQVRNAARFEAAGAARVFTRDATLGDDIVSAVNALGDDPGLRATMGQAARSVVPTDATERIAALIRTAVEQR